MLNPYKYFIFYRGEFYIDNDYFGDKINLDFDKIMIKENIRKNNENNNTLNVIISSIEDKKINFFVKVKENEKKNLNLNLLKKKIFHFIFNQIDNEDDKKFLTYINKHLILVKIHADACYKELEKFMKYKETLFSEKEIKSFFHNVMNVGLKENYNDFNCKKLDKRLENNLTGIFDIEDSEFLSNDNDFHSVGNDIYNGKYDNSCTNDFISFLDEDNETDESIANLYKYLVGVKQFKREIEAISRFAKLNFYLEKSSTERTFPFHYIFTIEPGMGVTTILETFAEVLYKLKLLKSKKVIEYNGNLTFSTKGENNNNISGIFYVEESGNIRVDDDYGIIAIDMRKQLGDPDFNFNKLMEVMKKERGHVIFVLLISGKDKVDKEKLIKRIRSKVNCHHIDFPEYTDEELVEIGRLLLRKYGFELEEDAENYLIERIKLDRQIGICHNIRTVQKIIEEVRVEKIFNFNGDKQGINKLDIEDFNHVKEENEISDPWEELNDMIGLHTVKQRIKEIASYAKYKKKLSEIRINEGNNCYHMIFTGNPGTGKTTVARIVGKIFKQIGVLKNGDTYEVGRDGLIGRYVGHTAPKVREKVREALGSVLFIDEAYSLYQDYSSKDYGHEAISTLIKEMEDKRNELIVIMAGYTDEMQKLIDMNPGIEERVPYKIEFPDYNADELTQIFLKLLGKHYKLEKGVYEKIHNIFEEACKNKGKNFANGRLARNIAERLKIKHSLRICEKNLYRKEDILTIKLKDIEELLKDDDVQKSIKNPNCSIRKIGFITD